MDEIKKILVALGFSGYAKGTFNYSAKLAKIFGAELIVANIINARDVSAVASVDAMNCGSGLTFEYFSSNKVKISSFRTNVLKKFLSFSFTDNTYLVILGDISLLAACIKILCVFFQFLAENLRHCKNSSIMLQCPFRHGPQTPHTLFWRLLSRYPAGCYARI